MNNRDVAKFLYDGKIRIDKPIENPEGESLALLELFDEINALGYDYHYIADVELRPIKDIRVMHLLWKYLPRMESVFTIEIFIRKIEPKKIPQVLDFAIEKFSMFSPSDKMHLTGFDEVISKGEKTEVYFDRVFGLLNDGDSYATLSETKKMLGKSCPEKLLPYTHLYRHGVLLPLTLRDCIFYPDDETSKFLNRCISISNEELTEIIGQYDYKTNAYRYPISVTMFEYWKKLCTLDFVHREAKKVIRERNKRYGLASCDFC